MHGTKYMRDLRRSKEYKRGEEDSTRVTYKPTDQLLLIPMTKHVVVHRTVILLKDFTSTISIPHATVKHRVEVTDDSCESSSLKHIQDPIDALRRPLRGGSLRGGRAGDRRTRRSKREDHGLANPAFDETMESRILEGVTKDLGSNHLSASSSCKYHGKELNHCWWVSVGR